MGFLNAAITRQPITNPAKEASPLRGSVPLLLPLMRSNLFDFRVIKKWWPEIILSAIYVLVFGHLLGASGFLPYVMDNNESFSAFWHARNLFEFGLGKSFGLADESFAYFSAAHPFVHTHQGNFPRLFALLIYALGARTIESQIVITTFTIGLLAVYFAFHFFAKITNPIFALLTCLILITDYVLVAQWQVVTYRVWHGFFIFSTLLCVHGIYDRTRIWPILAVLNSAALFYFEFVFVAFLSIAAALYAMALYWRTPRLIVKSWAMQAIGGVVGLGILVTQLVLYMGWEDFLHDAYLTFVARNQFSGPELLAQLRDFFDKHNVVFWYNLEDGSQLRTLRNLVSSLTYYELQIHTPFFTVLTSMPILALALGTLWHYFEKPIRRWRMKRPGAATQGQSNAAFLQAAMAIYLIAALLLLFLAVLNGRYFLGISPELQWFSLPGVETVIAAGGLALVWYFLVANFTGRIPGAPLRWAPPVSAFSVLNRLSTFLLVAAVLIIGNWRLFFYREYGLLWEEIMAGALPDWASRLLLVCTVFVSSLFVILGPQSRLVNNATRLLRPLCPFLITGIVAYIIVYVLSPGYIFSGYRVRMVPFTAFHDVVLMSGGLYLLGSAAVHCLSSSTVAPSFLRGIFERLGGARETVFDTGGRRAKFGMLGTGVLASLVAVVCGYFWISMQMTYLRLLPPDHYSFLRKLAEPPFKGASFVTNTYAAPVAAFTGRWAYFHVGLSKGKLPSKDGVLQIAGDDTYMWFADKWINPEYQRPQYYLCATTQAFPSVLAKLRSKREGDPDYPGCAKDLLVRLATGKSDQRINPPVELAAIDTEGPKTVGYERWAIVKFNW